MASTNEMAVIHGETTMGEILSRFPGARRALFARYHIGGCQSCSYADEETLQQVCERNEGLVLEEVMDHILHTHESDARMLIEPVDLKNALSSAEPPRLIDLRTSEEQEAVTLPGAESYSSELLQSIFSSESKNKMIVVYDHKGDRSLDVASFLVGHGFEMARALRGGIDAYAQEADPSLPRYRTEIE